jgi:CheY-like chemotaxis protein
MLDLGSKPDLPTLLVIDDDLVSREVMATVLTMTGYSVHTAAGGEAAVQLLSRGCAPSMILLDAQMPGLSGIGLIKEIRALTAARVITVSASKPPDDLLAAADGFLLKPFTAESVSKLLAGQEPQASLPFREGPPSTVFDPDEPVVNPETLAKLREMMPEASVKQIYTAIIADLYKRLPAIEDAVAKGNAEEVRRIGHSIKGGCGMAGAMQAAHLGALLQNGVLETADVGSHAGGGSRNQLDNSTSVISDLRAAARNLESMLEAEFPT